MIIVPKGRCLPRVMAGLVLASAMFAQAATPPPLPIEPTGVIQTLPATYPPSWFLVHDAAFFHMGDGKVYVIDTAADTLAEQVKGTFNVALIGNIIQSAKRGEVYATETFHTRGSRGDRMDVLTVFDQQTLAPKGEVILRYGMLFFCLSFRY